MKKLTVLSSLFVVAFALALGMTVMFHSPAKAIWVCDYECMFRTECTTQTGPLCGGGAPYYVYKKSTCAGGPLNCPNVYEWIGCWNGTLPCRPLFEPEP